MILLFPSKMKFKKYQKQKRRFKGTDSNYFFPKFGYYGLKSLNNNRLTSKHIETIRQFVQKKLSKKIKEKIKICIFPDLCVTKKSSGIRMGKGKGTVDYWCYTVISGRILLELSNIINEKKAKKILEKSSNKLPLNTRVILKKKIYVIKIL